MTTTAPPCSCAGAACNCVLNAGSGVEILGAGTPSNPFVISAQASGNGTSGGRITGEIIEFAGANAPPGWLLCNGQAVSRTSFANLFAVIGTTYGAGNGTSTFNVPDHRGRVGFGATDSRPLGTVGGAESTRLDPPNLPWHNHPMPHAHPMPHTHANDHDHANYTIDPGGQHAHQMSHNHGVRVSSQAGGHTHDTNNVGLHTHPTSSSGNHTHPVTFIVRKGEGTNPRNQPQEGTGNTAGTLEITTAGAGGHTHTAQQNGRHTHTALQAGGHTHNVDLPLWNGYTDPSQHTHGINLPPFTGRTGPTGMANTGQPTISNTSNVGQQQPFSILPPYIASNFLIKT